MQVNVFFHWARLHSDVPHNVYGLAGVAIRLFGFTKSFVDSLKFDQYIKNP